MDTQTDTAHIKRLQKKARVSKPTLGVLLLERHHLPMLNKVRYAKEERANKDEEVHISIQNGFAE